MKCSPVVHYSDGSAGQLSVLFNYTGELVVARLMDTTSEVGYSDPCRRVIKPPLREVGNPIYHGGNEMKMNSISFPPTNVVCSKTVAVFAVSEGSAGQEGGWYPAHLSSCWISTTLRHGSVSLRICTSWFSILQPTCTNN